MRFKLNFSFLPIAPLSKCNKYVSPGLTWMNVFPIVHDRDKFSNREQSETNRNDENAMCDYFSK